MHPSTTETSDRVPPAAASESDVVASTAADFSVDTQAEASAVAPADLSPAVAAGDTSASAVGSFSPASATPDRVATVQRLFVQHAVPLRGFITALMPDLARVDDVFQETFLTVTAKSDAFDPSRDFLPWACGIARNKVREAGRSAARPWQPLSEEVIDALVASEPAYEREDERLLVLGECIGALPPHGRRVVELCYRQMHKPAEVARVMMWSVEAVYVALSRARASLRQCLDRKLAGGGGVA
jgi:RNA polymerase sigma-70 factor (ECF subfamily)